MMAILLIGGILLAVFLLPRLIGKGVGAVFDAGQKAVFKKQIAESDDLIDVPLVLTSSATPAAILDALDAIIHPSKEAPGFGSVLYEVSREPMRAVYAIGSKLQPQQLVTELRLSEHDGKTEMVFRVLAAMRTDNIFIYKEALLRLREQVRYVAESGNDEAKLAEGAHIYRALEPEVAQRQTTIFRAGSIALIVAVLWLAIGVEVRLLPVWLMLAAGGGTLVYLGRKPVAKREREASAEAASALHPDLAQDPILQPAAAAIEVAEPAAVTVPVAESAAAAVVEPLAAAAAPMTPAAPLTEPGPGLVARFKAMPQQAKLVVAFGTIITVLIVVIVVIVGSGNSRDSYAEQSDVYAEEEYRYEGDEVPYEGDDVAIEVDSDALSPDTHARTEDDLFSSAPSDGSMEFADVVYAGGGDGEDDVVSLEFTLVSRSPAEWYIVYVPIDLGYYIDDNEVSMTQFFDAINSRADARGMIVFNSNAVYELHIYTQGQKASASTPEKDQVTIVPEYLEFGSEIDETAMEWSDYLDAYIASIEQGFKDAGLNAIVELVPYTGTEIVIQEPEAGMAVPVGTTVNITIPVAD